MAESDDSAIFVLTSIIYSGTKEEWDSIEGVKDADIKPECIVHCVDGDITIDYLYGLT